MQSVSMYLILLEIKEIRISCVGFEQASYFAARYIPISCQHQKCNFKPVWNFTVFIQMIYKIVCFRIRIYGSRRMILTDFRDHKFSP
jgi:hypothetical protein